MGKSQAGAGLPLCPQPGPSSTPTAETYVLGAAPPGALPPVSPQASRGQRGQGSVEGCGGRHGWGRWGDVCNRTGGDMDSGAQAPPPDPQPPGGLNLPRPPPQRHEPLCHCKAAPHRHQRPLRAPHPLRCLLHQGSEVAPTMHLPRGCPKLVAAEDLSSGGPEMGGWLPFPKLQPHPKQL